MSTTLSNTMHSLNASPTSVLLNKVAELRRQGKDIISLNVGEPDFNTPDYIKKAGIEAINNNFTRYTAGAGILELREAIIEKLKRDNHVSYNTNAVTVAVGAKQALASAVMAVAGRGDEVIIPVPCYVSYPEMVKLAGGTPVYAPLNPNDYTLDLEAIEKVITPKTKAIIICTPNNPTGTVYSEESLRALADLAIKYDFFIITDEVYEKLIYGDVKHFSLASISEEVRDHTILVNGFSKTYAMTGWRLGYAAARQDVIQAILTIQSQTTSAPASMVQKAAVTALRGPQDDVEVMRQEFERRRDYTVNRLRSIKGITCPDVQGAFYVFFDITTYIGKRDGDTVINTDQDLCEYLLEKAYIACVPGSAYLMDNKIRVSYSTSMTNLEEALNRMEEVLSYLK